MPATVATFQDHFISVARPRPRHQIESLEGDRLPGALAPPVLVRSLVQPLERGVDLGELRRLARGVQVIHLFVRGLRPLLSLIHVKGRAVPRLLLKRLAVIAVVARERVRYARSLLQQSSFQMLPLCRGQRHALSPWEIAAGRTSRKHREAAAPNDGRVQNSQCGLVFSAIGMTRSEACPLRLRGNAVRFPGPTRLAAPRQEKKWLSAIAPLAPGSRDIGTLRPDSVLGNPRVQDMTAAVETMNRGAVVHHSGRIRSAKNVHAVPRTG